MIELNVIRLRNEINLQIFNKNGKGNFGVLLDYYKQNENVNHFSPLIHRKGNGIIDEKLLRIKKIVLTQIQKKKLILKILKLKK